MNSSRRPDLIGQYLGNVSNFHRLTRSEEVASSRRVQKTRRQYRKKLLQNDFILRELVGILGKLQAGQYRLERVVEVPTRRTEERLTIERRLQPNLETIQSILHRNDDSFQVVASSKRTKASRRVAWRVLQRGRHKAARLIEELRLREHHLEASRERLWSISDRMTELQDQLTKASNVPCTSAERRELDFLMQLTLEHPATLMLRMQKLKVIRQRYVDATRQLAAGNLRLVISIARRFAKGGFTLPDLIQEGNVGLMRAVVKYDPDRGCTFSTYATWWIRQSIQHAMAKNVKTVMSPTTARDSHRRIQRAWEQLSQQLGRLPHMEEICLRAGLPVKRTQKLMGAARPVISLDDEAMGRNHRGSGHPLGSSLVDTRVVDPLESLSHHDLCYRIQDALTMLTDREQLVLRLRYGLHDGECRTYQEIGNWCSLTRERARQIEVQAIAKLRGTSNVEQLRDYFGSESSKPLVDDGVQLTPK